MKPKEQIDLINGIEQRYPVNTWYEGGIQIWPLVRILVGFNLYKLYKIDVANGSEKKLSLNKNLIRFFAGWFKFIFAYLTDNAHNARIKNDVDFVLFTTNYCRFKIGDEYYDRCMDPIVDILNKHKKNYLVLERGEGYKIPRYSNSRLINFKLSCINIVAKIKYRLEYGNKDNCLSLNGFTELSGFIRKEHNICLPNISEQVFVMNEYVKYFKKILNRTNPHSVIIVSFYDVIGMALIKACKDLGIRTMDLQHGTLNIVSYNNWSSIPGEGYQLLPSSFLCWSKDELKIIREWSQNTIGHKAIMIGNLFLNKWLLNNDDPLVKKYDGTIKELKQRTNRKIHILFTAQDIQLNSDILNAMKSNSSEYWWWIRLHPGYKNLKKGLLKLLSKEGISNFYIEEATELPLYSILRNVDIHMTMHSSVVMEAKSFGVYSILWSKLGAELYSEEIDNGFAGYAYDIANIGECIKNNIGKSRKPEGISSNVSTNGLEGALLEQ